MNRLRGLLVLMVLAGGAISRPAMGATITLDASANRVFEGNSGKVFFLLSNGLSGDVVVAQTIGITVGPSAGDLSDTIFNVGLYSPSNTCTVGKIVHPNSTCSFEVAFDTDPAVDVGEIVDFGITEVTANMVLDLSTGGKFPVSGAYTVEVYDAPEPTTILLVAPVMFLMWFGRRHLMPSS